MEIKHYDFHLSPLKPFIFEVMKIEPFSRPILPFYDTHEPLHLAYLYSGTLNSYVSGDCYLVPPWLPHRARKSDTGCTLGMVTLQPELLLPCFFEQQDQLRRLIMCSPQQLRVVLEKPQIKNAASRCFDELDLYQNSRPRQFAAIICFFSRLLEEDLSGIRMQFSLADTMPFSRQSDMSEICSQVPCVNLPQPVCAIWATAHSADFSTKFSTSVSATLNSGTASIRRQRIFLRRESA